MLACQFVCPAGEGVPFVVEELPGQVVTYLVRARVNWVSTTIRET